MQQEQFGCGGNELACFDDNKAAFIFFLKSQHQGWSN
jgi:hypothetical protein